MSTTIEIREFSTMPEIAMEGWDPNGSRVAYATVRIPARHVEEAKTGRDLALIVADLLR